MKAGPPSVTRAPQPRRVPLPALTTGFGLLGGPLAWFLQLCAGYGLASWSCFPKDQRAVLHPIAGASWSGPTIVALSTASVLIALASLYASWRLFRQAPAARERDLYHVIEDGDDRLAVLGLWGILLGSGFAVATLLNVIPFLVLPRCAG